MSTTKNTSFSAEISPDFGSRLRWVRQSFGLTLEQFGERIGVTRSYVCVLEKGAGRMPSRRVLKDICRSFLLREDWLESGTGEPFMEFTEKEIAEKWPVSWGGGPSLKAIMERMGADALLFMKRAVAAMGSAASLRCLFDIISNPAIKSDRKLALISAFSGVVELIYPELFEPPIEKKGLPAGSVSRKNDGVKTEVQRLLEKVARLTRAKGRKAELAADLGVAQARVSEWLAGRYEPGGEITIKLLNWVQAQESASQRPYESHPQRHQ